METRLRGSIADTLSPHPTCRFLKGVVTLFSNNYPERLHAAYIYPCGGMLNALWKIVSVFIDPRTQAKVKMIHDPKDLVDCVPKEHLPQHLGGEAPERS